MKQLLIVLVLMGSIWGSDAQARQTPEEPPIYLYLQLFTQDRTPIEDPELVPDWLGGYLFNIQAALIVEGQSPQIVVENPEILGEAPSMLVGAAADYDIFVEPPYRALSITIQQFGDVWSFYITPYSPYPSDTLPIGAFGWTSIITVEADTTPPDRVVELTVGEALYVVGDCEGAIERLGPLRETYDSPEGDLLVYGAVRFYEASCHYELGDLEIAAKLFQEIIKETEVARDPDQPFDERWFADTAVTNLAAIYIENGQTAAALALLDRFADLGEGFVNIAEREFERYFARAALYMALDEGEKAIRELDQIIAIVEVDSSQRTQSIAWLYTERGYLYEQLGDEDSALADYERAIETDSTYPVSYYRRGLLGMGNAAQQDFAMFLELAPNFGLLHHPLIEDLIEDAESRVE